MDSTDTDARTARRQRDNDRNAVIAFVLGLLLVLGNLFGIAAGATTGSGQTLAAWLMGIGVVLIALGLFFKGRPVR